MTITPLCVRCRHLDRKAPAGKFRCAAFPARIPKLILLMKRDHRRPLPGDHGIRFDLRPEAPAHAKPG